MKGVLAIQADPLECLNFETDTTLMVAYAAQRSGFKIFLYPPSQLSLSLQEGEALPAVHARGCWVRFLGHINEALYERSEDEIFDLKGADVVWIRQNPPFDMAYLTATYLLEKLPSSVLVINRPSGLRNCPEKIFPLQFLEFSPPTLVSRDLQEIQEFIKTHQRVVIKPLYLFGGKEIYLCDHHDDTCVPKIMHLLQKDSLPLMVQKYLPEVITEGDKRVLLLDGELLGLYQRIPQKGSFLANMAQGSQSIKSTYTARDKAIVEALRPPLREQGLLFVGLDIIAGYLTEINVTSPMGLAAHNALEHKALEERVWQKIESMIAQNSCVSWDTMR